MTEVSVTVGKALNDLDFIVNAFDYAIGESVEKAVEDIFLRFLQGF